MKKPVILLILGAALVYLFWESKRLWCEEIIEEPLPPDELLDGITVQGDVIDVPQAPDDDAAVLEGICGS